MTRDWKPTMSILWDRIGNKVPSWKSPKSKRAKRGCLRSRDEERRVLYVRAAGPASSREGIQGSRNETDRGRWMTVRNRSA